MLGDHEGIGPASSTDELAKILLRTFGRLKAGKDVPQRKRAIDRALASTPRDDRHWPEILASKLASEDGIDAIPAHLGAFTAAWSCQEDEVARHLRAVNTQGQDPFSSQATMGLMSAAPEFGERIKSGKVNSDEVFLRVALAHFFRRDPSSSFSMFVIDGVVRQLSKAIKLDVSSFVRACLERFDDEPAPEGAWGYVLVLREMSARSGYFLYPPSQENRNELDRMRARMEQAMGPLEDAAFYNHIAGAALSAYLFRGDAGSFAGLYAAMAEKMGQPFTILYGREEQGPDGGVHTQILDIPAQTPEEARRLAVRLPEVRMHDDFRSLTEFMAQQQDLEATTKQ